MKNNNPDLLFQPIIFRIKILENKKKKYKENCKLSNIIKFTRNFHSNI